MGEPPKQQRRPDQRPNDRGYGQRGERQPNNQLPAIAATTTINMTISHILTAPRKSLPCIAIPQKWSPPKEAEGSIVGLLLTSVA